MFVALDLFCLTVAVTMPSATELSVFIGVGGWVKLSSWSVILRGIDVYPLWNSPRGRHHMLEDYVFRVDWAIFWWQEVWRFFWIGR